MMKQILLFLAVTVLLSGCGEEGPVSVSDGQDREITGDEILAIAGLTDDLSDESYWIACSIGAQLLESKYERFTEAGLDESVLERLPDNQLTNDIKRLYLDMKPLVQ